MHYRNGRKAKNGDKIVTLIGAEIVAFGVLHSATAGNDCCNGEIAPLLNNTLAFLCDCLHADDIGLILKAYGLGQRPDGK